MGVRSPFLASSGVLALLLLAAVPPCAPLCTTISSPREQHCLRFRGVALVPSVHGPRGHPTHCPHRFETDASHWRDAERSSIGADQPPGTIVCTCDRIRVCQLLALTAAQGGAGRAGARIQYAVGVLCLVDFMCGLPAVSRVLRCTAAQYLAIWPLRGGSADADAQRAERMRVGAPAHGVGAPGFQDEDSDGAPLPPPPSFQEAPRLRPAVLAVPGSHATVFDAVAALHEGNQTLLVRSGDYRWPGVLATERAFNGTVHVCAANESGSRFGQAPGTPRLLGRWHLYGSRRQGTSGAGSWSCLTCAYAR